MFQQNGAIGKTFAMKLQAILLPRTKEKYDGTRWTDRTFLSYDTLG